MLTGALSFHQAKGEKSTEAKPPKVIVRQATSRAGRVPIHQPLPQIATPFGLQLVHLCSSRGPIVPRLRHQRKVTQPRHGLHARRPASCGARSGAAAIRLRASCFISGRGRAPPGNLPADDANATARPHRPAERCGLRPARRPVAAGPAPTNSAHGDLKLAAMRQALASGRARASPRPEVADRPPAPDGPLIFGAPGATRPRSQRAERTTLRASRGGRPASAAPSRSHLISRRWPCRGVTPAPTNAAPTVAFPKCSSRGISPRS
jgi:hypothetical protein